MQLIQSLPKKDVAMVSEAQAAAEKSSEENDADAEQLLDQLNQIQKEKERLRACSPLNLGDSGPFSKG